MYINCICACTKTITIFFNPVDIYLATLGMGKICYIATVQFSCCYFTCCL